MKGDDKTRLTPTLVDLQDDEGEDIIKVVCGSRHTIVLTQSGRYVPSPLKSLLISSLFLAIFQPFTPSSSKLAHLFNATNNAGPTRSDSIDLGSLASITHRNNNNMIIPAVLSSRQPSSRPPIPSKRFLQVRGPLRSCINFYCTINTCWNI